MAYTIGSQTFVRMDPPPFLPAYTMSERTRPAVDGRAFKLMGRRADPFTVSAGVDVTDYTTAFGLPDSYASMVGTIVAISYGPTLATTSSFNNFLILDAKVTDAHQMALARGGITNGSVWVESQWTLQYVGTA